MIRLTRLLFAALLLCTPGLAAGQDFSKVEIETIEIDAQQNVAGEWTVRYDILGQALEVGV